MSLFHSNTELLIDYWRNRAAGADMPARTSINPSDFADILPQVFVLGRVRSGVYPVRLAGGFVGDLHQRDLRQHNALALWSERDRSRLQTALEETRLKPEPLIATAEILTGGPSIGMEVLFAPLSDANGEANRYLGLYQPLSMVARLEGRPALELSVRNLRRASVANTAAPRIRLATVDGRRIA